MSRKLICLITAGIIAIVAVSLYLDTANLQTNIISPLISKNKPKPLTKYYFENLAKREYRPSEIKLVSKITNEDLTGDGYQTQLFTYQSSGKTVSGMAKIPNSCKNKKCPVVIMLRGYVDDEIYFTGIGTHKAAGYLAQNGFITLAPDFLGFGQSDQPSKSILESRFTRPITVINLIETVKKWDKSNGEIKIWAHSNGGQIALSVLETTRGNYPTTLWAPVTIGFPESVFYYMDDYEKLDELGRQVHDTISQFCQDYDCAKVSVDSYFNQIQAPIQIHQGGADPLVPLEWSNQFVNQMKDLNKEINYYTYPSADHNLKQNWDEVIKKDLLFLSK